jgi:hypothetical protein
VSVANVTGRSGLAVKLRTGPGAQILLSDSSGLEPFLIGLGDVTTIQRGLGKSELRVSSDTPGVFAANAETFVLVIWSSDYVAVWKVRALLWNI